MKSIWLLILSIGCLTGIHAQTVYTEIGAVGSFFSKSYSQRGRAFGGQITANYQLANGIVLGAGFQALQFNKPFLYGTDNHKGYYPLYAKVGYNISASPLVISIHAEEGYAFYKNTGIGPADGPVPVRGGMYFSPGIALYGTKRFSPYIDLRYTRYQFKTDYGSSKSVSNLSAFTASLGFCMSSHKRKK